MHRARPYSSHGDPPILDAPDPRLRVISTPVERSDDGLRTVIAEIFETMYDGPNRAQPLPRPLPVRVGSTKCVRAALPTPSDRPDSNAPA
jgi:hypothetical protein